MRRVVPFRVCVQIHRGGQISIPNERKQTLSSLLGHGMDGLSEVVNIGGSDTGDRDAAVLGEVDVVLLGEPVNLGRGEAGVAKHADLVGDVLPVLLATKLLKAVAQLLSHADNAVGHQFDLLIPILFF